VSEARDVGERLNQATMRGDAETLGSVYADDAVRCGSTSFSSRT
jgi:hypothetical protein